MYKEIDDKFIEENQIEIEDEYDRKEYIGCGNPDEFTIENIINWLVDSKDFRQFQEDEPFPWGVRKVIFASYPPR